jgi:hypothetical protein
MRGPPDSTATWKAVEVVRREKVNLFRGLWTGFVTVRKRLHCYVLEYCTYHDRL